MRRIPSLRGLQAFEAVARAGNLAAAANMLAITVSAVSHRIRGLEEELGVRLFVREPTGLSLTAAGRRYRTGVEDAFDLLARATADLAGPDLSRPLTVSLTSEIGIRWLMPRFPRFRAAYPDIDIALLATYQLADVAAGEADMALRYGKAPWPGLEAEPFLSFKVSPLCSPQVMETIRGLDPAAALSRCTLIREDNNDWDTWLVAADADDVEPAGQISFADYSMGLAAAIAGQGMILGYSGYIQAEVASGALIQPFELTVPVEKAYYLVYPEARLSDDRVRAFRDWVISERRVEVESAEDAVPDFQAPDPAGILNSKSAPKAGRRGGSRTSKTGATRGS
jgi:LysR family transcriptional regulator, glycine cleavage system transcriptional activator